MHELDKQMNRANDSRINWQQTLPLALAKFSCRGFRVAASNRPQTLPWRKFQKTMSWLGRMNLGCHSSSGELRKTDHAKTDSGKISPGRHSNTQIYPNKYKYMYMFIFMYICLDIFVYSSAFPAILSQYQFWCDLSCATLQYSNGTPGASY